MRHPLRPGDDVGQPPGLAQTPGGMRSLVRRDGRKRIQWWDPSIGVLVLCEDGYVIHLAPCVFEY